MAADFDNGAVGEIAETEHKNLPAKIGRFTLERKCYMFLDHVDCDTGS